MKSAISKAAGVSCVAAGAGHAAVISVAGPASSFGVALAIIAAPADALDDIVTNAGMQGFNEAQGVTLSSPVTIDGGGSIAAGTLVDSQMIFLNSAGSARLDHYGVDWTFSGAILGVKSNGNGSLEAASTSQLGAPGTNYTVTFPGSGPEAPFTARGLEGNNGTGLGNDGYAFLAPNQLRVGMRVTEPGDWIRVVTATPIPLPASFLLLLAGLMGLAFVGRRCRLA